MSIQREKVEGFEAFQQKLKELGDQKTKIVLFSGSKDESGNSWCPDCVKAEPIIEDVLEGLDSRDDIVFLYVGVGPRDFWKDPKCIFRTDPSTRLKGVPTLIRWGTQQRLEEEQCAKKDMVEMLFQDD